VNISAETVTIYSDGVDVCNETGLPMPGAASGIFFSTFDGGHDLSYSPKITSTNEMADFSLSTALQNGTPPPPPSTPATPTALKVTGSTASSISLSWTEANNTDPAVSYDVYEGSTVVATSKTTSATISSLAAGSSHTYTVAAVDAAGNASAQSASVTGSTTGKSSGLTVSITNTKASKGEYTDCVTVTNGTTSAINGWNVQFSLPSGETVTSSTDTTHASSGSHYTLTPTSAYAKIAVGKTRTFKFSGDYTGTYGAPTGVTVTTASSTGGQFNQADIGAAVIAPLRGYQRDLAAYIA